MRWKIWVNWQTVRRHGSIYTGDETVLRTNAVHPGSDVQHGLSSYRRDARRLQPLPGDASRKKIRRRRRRWWRRSHCNPATGRLNSDSVHWLNWSPPARCRCLRPPAAAATYRRRRYGAHGWSLSWDDMANLAEQCRENR